MIYIDSCAAVKLVREEPESTALRTWLDARPDALVVSSELALTEVLRVVRRGNHDDQGVLVDATALAAELGAARTVLDGLALVTLDRETLHRAAMLEAPMIHTLDAVHLASAMEWPAHAVEFVTYDRRLAAAAAAMEISVVSPS